MKRWMKYILAALLPIGILLSKPVVPLLITLFGEDARLSVEALDPREVFRGDYVELSFGELEELSTYEQSKGLSCDRWPEPDRDFGKEFYVTLARDSAGIDRPSGIFASPPAEGLYIRGSIRHSPLTGIRLDFGPGLKRFYVKENTGRAVEDAMREGRAAAVVKIWRGMPLLVSLDIKPKAE